MGEDQSGKKETRSVFGDLSNQKLGKRGFSSISSSPTSESKSGIWNKKNVDSKSEDADSHFRKQVSKAVESLEKERYGKAKCSKVLNESSGLSPLSGGKVYRLRTSSGGGGSVHGKTQTVLSSPAREVIATSGSRLNMGKCQTLISIPNLGDIFKERVPSIKAAESSSPSQISRLEVGKECQGEETVVISRAGENVVSLGDTMEENIPSAMLCESSRLFEKNYLECGKEFQGDDKTLVISITGENVCTQESLTTEVARDDCKTLVAGCLPSSRCETVLSSRLIESHDRESHGLKRCRVLKADGCSNSAADLDMLKLCSCSFCTKASYIWSDLHYQDVKGRISVLTKSQNEATNLAQKYAGENEKTRHGQGQGQYMRDANLENDLSGQWKSLFLHMENIFAIERGQLQSNLAALKDIREDFKMTTDSNTGMPSDVQQCSSDASHPSVI